MPKHCGEWGVGVERPDDKELERVADSPPQEEA